jgi:ATP-dependent DNA helicase RecG
MLTLETPVKNLTRVGQKVAKKLNELGIFNARDLLFYFPFRYDDFSRILPIKEAVLAQDAVTVRCTLEMIENHRSPRRHKIFTEALVADDSGKMKVIWFNQPFMAKVLVPGDKIYLSGKVTSDFWGTQMVNPVYEKETAREALHTGRVVPIYPLTENLSQKQLRFLIKLVLPARKYLHDPLPQNIKREMKIFDLLLALEFIHFPKNKEEAKNAAKRFKFEELFYLQLENELSRRELLKEKAPKVFFFEKYTKNFVDLLPYKLTEAQRKSAWEILTDLGARKKPAFVSPMNRLLNGDVGSGKTVVAGIAVFNVILNKFQAAFMAPTEILALQHFNTFAALFKNLDLKIGLLTRGFSKIFEKGEIKEIKKSKLLKEIESGEIRFVIGTHALIQDKIKFHKLALAIVDEQHRFGVKQRARLSVRGLTQIIMQNHAEKIFPHFLSLTATPIPRTLALIAYGDLDISILNEMPKGRKPIITKLVWPEFKADAYSFVRQEIKSGRQAFVICPLIDPSDKLGVRSVKEEFEKLKNEIFPEFEIAVLHGKMKSAEKNKIMTDFKDGKTQILVSTTVVEVGVDVPNATMMIIEGAERFGLAQLHQLRGRVGRGECQSYCLVFLETSSKEASQRLKIFADTLNGFELAEHDLKFRGPGDILGIRQSGLPTLKFANLDDIELLKLARDEAKKYVNFDPEFKKAALLRQELEKRRREVHLE